MTLNWKNIEQYECPDGNDLLFRIEEESGNIYFTLGFIDAEGDIFTKGKWGENAGHLCHMRALYLKNIKSIHYVNPLEIKL